MEQEPGIKCPQCQCVVPSDCIDPETGLCDECMDPPYCEYCGAVTSYENSVGDWHVCDECLKGTCKKCGAPGKMVPPDMAASDVGDFLCDECFEKIF